MTTRRYSPGPCGRRSAGGPGRLAGCATLATLLLILMLPLGANGQISRTSGDVRPVTHATILAAGSVAPGAFTSDDEIRLFMEKEDVELASDMDVDITAPGTYGSALTPGVIAAGEAVTSIMVHADRASATGRSNLSGSIEFNMDILGVIVLSTSLDACDAVVGLDGVTYPTGALHRGMDLSAPLFPDEIILVDNRLELNLVTFYAPDQLRVILAGSGRGVSFSIDWQGPTHDMAPSFGTGPITAGSILTPGDGGPPGPNQPVVSPSADPGVMLTPADLSITNPGIPFPGKGDIFEVDALSFGRDRGRRLRFSVDEFATGVPGGTAPDVYSEGDLGNDEASADVFAYLGPFAVTYAPTVLGNRAVLDGNGLASAGRPGFKLVEPNDATWKALPDLGDNLDALDLNTRAAHLQGNIFFSLDGDEVDWAETGALVPPPNNGTAQANLVSGADVLMTRAGAGSFWKYASAEALGLDPDEDDIDALIVVDDGDGEFTPGVDMIRFSLRRGSASLGRICPASGLPITEADVLGPGPVIYIRGEALGLFTRTGADITDDLDALDLVPPRHAPIGNPDHNDADPGWSGVIPILDNDFPLDGQLVPSSVVIFEPPEFGSIDGIDPLTGAIHYSHDGSPVMQDFFTYIVFDDRGEFTDPTPVLITFGLTGVEPVEAEQPLRQPLIAFAGPNPFSSETSFMLRPTQSGPVTVTIYNLAGRRVRTLLDEYVAAGESRFVGWDGRDGAQRPAATGVYLVEMRSGMALQRMRTIKLK